jgi:hypothetical protein
LPNPNDSGLITPVARQPAVKKQSSDDLIMARTLDCRFLSSQSEFELDTIGWQEENQPHKWWPVRIQFLPAQACSSELIPMRLELCVPDEEELQR